MSWEALGEKKVEHLGGIEPEPYFSADQIAAAREAVAAAQAAAPERETSAHREPGPAREKKRRS
jgi:hypothetical protein